MTPTRAAAGADHQQTWTTGLRISEVAQRSSAVLEQPSRMPVAAILKNASGYLRAGWKWLESKRTLQLSSRRLRVAESISLGEKRSVSIVQVDGAQFLIGCSTGSVQLLAVLDGKDGMHRIPSVESAS